MADCKAFAVQSAFVSKFQFKTSVFSGAELCCHVPHGQADPRAAAVSSITNTVGASLKINKILRSPNISPVMLFYLTKVGCSSDHTKSPLSPTTTSKG